MASAKDGQRIKAEIDTDPLTRGYAGMTDKEVSVDMQVVTRPGLGTVEQLRGYFLLEKKANMFLYGRLAMVAKGVEGTDPIGEGALTQVQITSALTMINILNPVSGFSLDLNDSRFDGILDDLSAGAGSKVIGNADKIAIQNMSVNVRTRAQELEIGDISEGAVAYARSLS